MSACPHTWGAFRLGGRVLARPPKTALHRACGGRTAPDTVCLQCTPCEGEHMEHARGRGIVSGRRLLADHVFRGIADEILAGRLPDGHILRDHEVARRLNVSRTPVREALMRLERIGLVEIEPSRFTRVTPVTDEVIDQHRELAGYAAGTAAHMAVRRMTDDELARAVDHAEAAADALGDPATASTARHALFSYLSAHSGNPAHHALMADTEVAITRALSRAPLRDVGIDDQRAEYDAIVGALRARDADRLERIIRAQHGISEGRT
ncbi:GntR family transcriptional regulator [Microbacterium sp. PM5]|nr:GntR family transcriptional regulator [Microbacterium sp. PM5]